MRDPSRAAWLLVLALAGCRSSGPEAGASPPAAAQPPVVAPAEPEPGPIPVLALVPGSIHRFRYAALFQFEVPGNPGKFSMDIRSTTLNTILDNSPKGEPRLEIAAERILVEVAMENAGLRMSFDSANEAQRRLAAGSGTLAVFKAFGQLAEHPVIWVRRSGSGGAWKREAPAPAGPGNKSDDFYGDLMTFAWVDLLPTGPIRTGDRGGLPKDAASVFAAWRELGESSWMVTSWDPAAGIGEFRCLFSGRVLNKKPDEEPKPLEVEFRDRFDVQGGRYLTRKISMRGLGDASSFPGGAEAGKPMKATVDVTIEREEEPPAGGSPPSESR